MDLDPDAQTIALVYIMLLAINIEHPLLNIIDYILIFTSILQMMFDSYERFEGLVLFLCGFGLIGLSGFISTCQKICKARANSVDESEESLNNIEYQSLSPDF